MAVLVLGAETFNETVDRDGIVIIDFWASWCGPCKMFAPVFEAASARHPDILFAKIDTEAQRELAQHFNIRSIPTLMVLKDRQQIYLQAGALTGGQFEQLIQAARALDMETRAEEA